MKPAPTPTEERISDRVLAGIQAEKEHAQRAELNQSALARLSSLAGAQRRVNGTVSPELREQIDRLRAPVHRRTVGADAAGMTEASYQRASFVVKESLKDRTFEDLVEQMDRTGNISHAYDEARRRLGNPVRPHRRKSTATRHVLNQRGLHPKHNEMLDRTARTLDGALMALALIEIGKLDRSRIDEWFESLSGAAARLRDFCKELVAYGNSESD